jgi:hypothetical protein
VDSFPANWLAGEPEENDIHSGGAVGHCVVSFYISDSVAFQEIYEYSTEDEAARGYTRLLGIFSYKAPDTFPAPTFTTSAADEVHLACATMAVGTSMCQFVARYGVYVVHFNSHFGPEIMTYEELEHALQAIDEKMARHGLAQGK